MKFDEDYMLAELKADGFDIEEYLDSTSLEDYAPYDFQKEHHSNVRERMLMAANRVGKTASAAAEAAYHALGEYPDWWEGYRFEKAPLIWVGSVTSETSRDITQKALIGGIGDELGTGLIPRSRIVGKPKMRQAGVPDVVETVRVKHKSGKNSKILFKSYDQGWKKWQGTEPQVVWMDEEPDDYKIYTEALTRVLTSHGTIMVTFTPLNGVTTLVLHFQDDLPNTQLVTATWDDAPHLDEKAKEELKDSYPDYERDARTAGVPMVGTGRVFPFSEEDIKVPPLEIQRWWPQIKGIDFGYSHPFGYVRLAIDREKNVVYVVECARKRKGDASAHAEIINRTEHWVPVSWPHDGHQHDKGSGKELRRLYMDEGVKMLAKSARYDDDKGGRQPVEPIVQEAITMMQAGQIKVFSTCTEFFEEFRSYHRDEKGVINPVREDVLKAFFYALMMRRFARLRPMRAPTQVMPSPGVTTRL